MAHSLLRSFVTVGSLTGSSRVLGFIRDVVIASTLGVSGATDAFYAAFRFTTLFRSVIGEGSLNAAFVPIFGRLLIDRGKDSAVALAEDAQGYLSAATLVLVAVLIATMPWLIQFLTPGFRSDPQQLALTCVTLQVALVYVFFMSLSAFRTAMLNSLQRFFLAGAAALAPNLVIVASALLLVGQAQAPSLVLAGALSLGGVVQFGLLMLGTRAAGYGLRLRRPRRGPDVARFGKLLAPVLVWGLIIQTNVFVGTILGSFFDGAVTYLYYAERIWQLPTSILVSSVAAVFLPHMVRELKSGNEAAALVTQNEVLTAIFAATLPCSVLISLLADPLVRLFFLRGSFTLADAAATADVVRIVAWAIPAVAMTTVLRPGFLAREDTVTPMKVALVSLIMNAGLATLLVNVIGIIGIPIAIVVSMWVNVVLSVTALAMRRHYRMDRATARRFCAVTAAALCMGSAVFGFERLFAPLLLGWGPFVDRCAEVVLPGLVALVVYLPVALLLGGIDRRLLPSVLRR
jgi:putative peptidoglycan lipid II flippase